MICLSGHKIFKNETVQPEKEGLQREELNWTWAAQTLVYLTPVLKEQVSTAGQVSTYSLVGSIICLLYVNSHQVSTPLSQSPAAPCTHHPLKGNEQLQASRNNADPLVFGFRFHCTHPQGPLSSQLTRDLRLAQMEMQLTLLFFCLSVTACRSHCSCISPLRQEKCLSQPCCSLPALAAKSNR